MFIVNLKGMYKAIYMLILSFVNAETLELKTIPFGDTNMKYLPHYQMASRLQSQHGSSM